MILWCMPCNKAVDARQTNGSEIYPHRMDLHHLIFYKCLCGANVGCHKNTSTPMGSLADAKLKKERMAAHKAFDDIYKTGKMTRGESYAWLSEKLGIASKECHIGMFNAEQCKQVVQVANEFNDKHIEQWLIEIGYVPD